MSRTEIRVTGFGGQGVVLLGYIVGRAYAINAGRHATMIQSFGPEARGSACSATLVLSDREILYPYVQQPDILITMSGEGYSKYHGDLRADGVLIYEEDLVRPVLRSGQPVYGIPATRLAEKIGRSLVQNIVMLGAFTAVTGVVTREQMREAVAASVPVGTEEMNQAAFESGFEYAAGRSRPQEAAR